MSAFLDSNVILYLAQEDDRRIATVNDLLERGATISVQVLNEITLVARRKFGYDWRQIDRLIGKIEALTSTVDLTVPVHRLGRQVAERYTLSVYDGMIVAAALTAGCETLYSEDMHDGLVVDGRLRIVNPFA